MKRMNWNLFTTLSEAVNWSKSEKGNKGCICPCCEQVVKTYKRKLNSSMAYALIIMYRLHKKHGFHRHFKMNEEIAKLGVPSSNIEYAKLFYWGLAVELDKNENPNTKTSGYWKLTKMGLDFVENRIKVEKYAYIYNGKLESLSVELTTLKEALGDKFNYDELMNS